VKTGDTVLVRRYGKRGRPSVRSVLLVLQGVVVKANGSNHVVLIDGKRVRVHARFVTLTEQT
jgi:hypothetical protein